jgi:hypothetical protein
MVFYFNRDNDQIDMNDNALDLSRFGDTLVLIKPYQTMTPNAAWHVKQRQ